MTQEMEELGKVTKKIVDACGVQIQEVWVKLNGKYDQHLGEGRNSSVLVGGLRKIEWLVREKDKVVALQEQLKTSTSRLSLLIATAAQ